MDYRYTLGQRNSENDSSKRDIPSFIEPRPPLILNPFQRPRPQKGTNLLELFEEDSECEEPELVQVYLRLKPCDIPSNLYEIRSDKCLITSVDTAPAGHGRRTQHNVSKKYTFSHIFGGQSTQKEIFEHVVKDNLRKLTEGHNFTLLTYGASGSGKTFTLMGTVASPGLVPRSLEYVFKVVEASQEPTFKPSDNGAEKLGYLQQEQEILWVRKLRQLSAPVRDKYRRMSTQLNTDITMSNIDLSTRTKHYVWVSFIEIYNEAIFDLLVPCDRRSASKLRIREDSNGQVFVKGASQAFVRTGEEAYDVMVAGKHNLQVAATGVHAQSSRSHCIFTITMLTDTENGVRPSYIRLCDLAGCERAHKTRNTGARMQESRAINSSLHVLERCLHMIRRRQKKIDASMVPYRESKLTRLLGAGLSGAKGESVSMVVTLNPSPEYQLETKHVLQLAAQARDIQVNHTIAESTFESSHESSTVSSLACSADVMRLKADNERLHFELLQAQSRNKELQCAMAESREEAASTMRELVEEAKDMTRQYYEAQLLAADERHRSEIEDLTEEFEMKLSKLSSQPNHKETPSKALQKISTLMTEIAILQEKLNIECLARERAEEEVQHLRACLEERDEKGSSDNIAVPEDDEVLSIESDEESDNESNEDPCDESLEPTFKKEDINRSRMIRQSLANDTLNCDKDESKLYDSVFEKLACTLKDDTIVEEDNENSLKDSTKDSTYMTGESYDASEMSSKIEASSLNETKAVSEDNTKVDKKNNFAKSQRETYFVNSVSNVDSIDIDDIKSNEPSNMLRGTYFVEDNFIKPNNSVRSKDISSISSNNGKNNMSIIEKINDSFASNLEQKDSISDKSLAQFEELESDAKTFASVKKIKNNSYFNYNVGKDMPEEFANIKILKEKRNFFDDGNENDLNKVNHLNNLDDLRSPSIVKDDIPNDFEPGKIINSLTNSLMGNGEALSSIHKSRLLSKTLDSVDMFECLDSPASIVDEKQYTKIVEDACKSVKKLNINVENNKEVSTNNNETNNKLEHKIDEIELKLPETVDLFTQEKDFNPESNTDNTIEEFESLYNKTTNARNTEFDMLLSQEEFISSNTTDIKIDDDLSKNETKVKYNLRRKTDVSQTLDNLKTDKVTSDTSKTDNDTSDNKTKENYEEVLVKSQDKCEIKARPKRNLRLRRRKNQKEADEENEIVEQESVTFKDIVNLQKEFSDVITGLPATKKVVNDIPSPEKTDSNDYENLPPVYGIQSCPSKSITRSRRKLFTPRAEPLEESLTQSGGANSTERLRVPRPSYHRPTRVRRKL